MPGTRKCPGGVQNTLHHGFEVEPLVDAQADLIQPGKTLPQGLDFVVGVLRPISISFLHVVGIRLSGGFRHLDEMGRPAWPPFPLGQKNSS